MFRRGFLPCDQISIMPCFTAIHGVGAIVRMKLAEDFPHVSFEGFFGNLELVGDDLVGVARGYLLQNLEFAIGQFVVGVMFG
jgi:hypothetical protein